MSNEDKVAADSTQELPDILERRVQVWFGKTVVADHTAEASEAAAYEEAMRRRFASLRVTSKPVKPDDIDDPTS